MRNKTPRKKTGPDERRALCQEWRTSGLSQAEFCKQHNVALSSFHQWLSGKRLDGPKPPVKDIPAWVPMKIKNTSTIAEEFIVIELMLPNKIGLKLPIAYSKINSVIEQLCHANTIIR
jgi:hypothetical protein